MRFWAENRGVPPTWDAGVPTWDVVVDEWRMYIYISRRGGKIRSYARPLAARNIDLPQRIREHRGRNDLKRTQGPK